MPFNWDIWPAIQSVQLSRNEDSGQTWLDLEVDWFRKDVVGWKTVY